MSKRRYSQCCMSTEHLVVHHVSYKNIGNELDQDVYLFCESCHNLLHRFIRGRDPDIKEFTKNFIKGRRFWKGG